MITYQTVITNIRKQVPQSQHESIEAYHKRTAKLAWLEWQELKPPLPNKQAVLDRDRLKRLNDLGIEEALRDKQE
jgi:hypothetical protein